MKYQKEIGEINKILDKIEGISVKEKILKLRLKIKDELNKL